ncbi:hypothetical protein DVH24_031880 [Malus domestica]|uniref:Uncharacterized protein n=1 Tax=Malus domestica TaxID=3750 RepID=A0A498J6V0_MALDO|nr:hypothetical protein DVH24_031880 [Malus domestica]
MPCAVLAHAGEDFEPLEHLMPWAVSAREGEDFVPLEHLIPYAVIARASDDFKPLKLLMLYAVLTRAGKDFEPLERYKRLRAICDLRPPLYSVSDFGPIVDCTALGLLPNDCQRQQLKSGCVAVWLLQCSDHLDLVGTSMGGLDHPQKIHGVDGSGGERIT